MTVPAVSSPLWRVVANAARSPSLGASTALLSPQQGIALTYSELVRTSCGLSKGLQDRGVGVGDVVVTDLPNVAEGLYLHLACAKLGAAVATCKDIQGLSKIPGTIQCAVLTTSSTSRTTDDSSWLSSEEAQRLIRAPPISANGSEFSTMLNDADSSSSDEVVSDLTDGSERALGYFASPSALTHGSALAQGEAMVRHLQMTSNDRVCVSITLYHAFGIGSACSAAFLSGAAVVLPAVGGLHGCGVPSQRASVTLDTLVSQKCTLLFADTHTLKALHRDDNPTRLLREDANLSSLRGGVCKTGSGSTILPGTMDLAGIQLSTLGKAG